MGNDNLGCILGAVVLTVAIILPFIYFPLIVITILVFASLLKHMFGKGNS